MKIYYYDEEHKHIFPCKDRVKKGKLICVPDVLSPEEDPLYKEVSQKGMKSSAQNICLQKQEGDFRWVLTEKSLEDLLSYCSMHSIQSEKVKVYTPELFLLERSEEYANAFLKLGSLVLKLDEGVIRQSSILDMTKDGFGKYIAVENIVVGEK